MTWSEPERAGLYVTHLDGAVEHFARRVVAQFREDEKETIIYDNLLRAIELFDALGVHGVRYIADPDNPYGSIIGGGEVLDLIRFPRETLTLKSGDCDDVSVLYAALLQNIGIDTALVDVTDHVFVIFDTGLRRHQAGQVARDASQLYIDGQDRVWVPVETTLLGESFSEAWKVGAAMLAERKYEIIEHQGVLEEVSSSPPPRRARSHGSTGTKRHLAALRAGPEDTGTDPYQRPGEEDPAEAGRGPRDISSLNELGILLAKNGYLRQAEARFRRVVALAPEFSGGHSNLANVLYERELYDEAVERYRTSLEIDPGSPEVHVELALTYWRDGQV